jgi:capsular polysaccharide biosynthesis protein
VLGDAGAGLALGIAIVLLITFLDRTLTLQEHVTRLIDLPVA